MAPNPHFRLDSSKVVSRNEIYADGAQPPALDDQERASTLKELNDAIRDSLVLPQPKRKKRKLNQEVSSSETTTPFRLVSRLLPPIPLCLQPKPPPPPITREPDVEDDDTQADLRRRQAEAAAVETSWVIKESVKPILVSSRKLLSIKASIQNPCPSLMVLRLPQMPRSTRPPVRPSELARYPYNAKAPVRVEVRPTTTMDLPIVDAKVSSSSKSQRKRTQERKRHVKARPPAKFWRPSPSWDGKCRGYAMGYPSYIAVNEERIGRGVDEGYRRDGMRKAICNLR